MIFGAFLRTSVSFRLQLEELSTSFAEGSQQLVEKPILRNSNELLGEALLACVYRALNYGTADGSGEQLAERIMQLLMCLGRWALTVSMTAMFPIVAYARERSIVGCYERVYDRVHLAAHMGQTVTQLRLSVAEVKPETRSDKERVAEGKLKIWVRGHSRSFDSDGACRADDKGLFCQGSLSAAEEDACKSTQDGVRNCRISSDDAGSFRIVVKPRGVMVVIHKRLELVQEPYDIGPFLYLSPTNAENNAFLLNNSSACK